MELPDLLESFCVVNKADLVLPGKLVDFAVQERDAFGEVRLGDVNLLQHLAGLQFDISQARPALLTGTLEKFALEENQSLCEGVRVVRPDVDDLIAVLLDNDVFRRLVSRLVCVRSRVAMERS